MMGTLSNLIKKYILLALLTTFPFWATGCWDKQEMDVLAIVTGIGVDAGDTPDTISFTAQIAEPHQSSSQSQDDSSQDSSSMLLKTTSRSILSAIESLNRESSRMLFLHHNQIVVFGLEQAQKGVLPYLDVLMRHYQMRVEVFFLVTDTKAEEILNTPTKPESVSSIYLTKLLRNENSEFSLASIKILDFVNSMLGENPASVAPLVKVEKKGETTLLAISELAVFKKDKMVGQLSGDQVTGYTWITGKITKSRVEVSRDSSFANLRLFDISSGFTPSITEKGELVINLNIKGKMVLEEIMGFDGMTIKKATELIMEESQASISKSIQNSLEAAQEYGADIFQFGEAYRKKYPEEWDMLNKDWDTAFSNIKINPTINLRLMDTEDISTSLQMKEPNQ